MAISARLQRRIVLLFAAASLACAPAPRMGDAVDIAEENAIIIWDAAAKTQHFIRRASFRTEAKDFGFLVPTPTTPALAESDDEAFDLLERITAPPEMPSDAKAEAPKAEPATAAAPAAVVVIATAKVAGYDAAVLEATDAGALDRWLKDNGYHSSPELMDWYKPYITQKWKITAFKIARDGAGGNRVESSAARMSFTTERPFFPYREPKSATAGTAPRLLRIYLLAGARFEGRIAGGDSWPGFAVWSKPLLANDRTRLIALLRLPAATAAGAIRLTEYEDGASPRPGSDDLFFSAAADQAELDKPPIWIPRKRSGSWDTSTLLAIALAIAVIAWLFRRVTRKPKQS